MLNQKKIIIFLSVIIFAVGCNAFVVPVTFLVSGIMGNTTDANKGPSSMRQSSKMASSEDISGTSEDTSGTSEDHISGVTMSKHISGTSTGHISGATMSEHISGTPTDHISGATISEHISGASVPAHLSGN